MERSAANYEQPQVTESFDEMEILGDAPEAAGTHVPQGSVQEINNA